MRQAFAIAGKELLVLFKDKAVLAVYFLMPLLFASLLGTVFGNTGGGGEEAKISIPVLLVDQDKGTYGQMLADGLSKAGVLVVTQMDDVTAADEQVADGKTAAAVIIPAGLSQKIDAGEPVQVTIIKDPSQQEAAAIVSGIVDQAMGEIGLVGELRYGIHQVAAQNPDYGQAPPELVQAIEAQTLGVIWSQVEQMRRDPVIAVQSEDVTGAEQKAPWNPITFYVPGFTVAFAFFLVPQMAGTLLKEKEEGTFRRLMSSPMPRWALVGGKMLAYMIVVFLQVIVLFTVGFVLFNMPRGSSPLGMALLTLALAVCSASLGMLLGALCRTSKQADSVGRILGFVLMALGGTIFPFFIMGDSFMATLSKLTPNAHALAGYMGLLADDWTLLQVLPQVAILFGFAAVFFGIAVWRFRFD
jgi:ABC-2 type transport system permease protein